MNKKSLFSFIIAMLFATPLFAGDGEIFIRVKPGTSTGSRTIIGVVTATKCEQALTLSFSDLTESSVMVYEASDPDTVLFSQTYAPAYSVQANLTTLPAGDYVVEIYAFNEWWIGEFEME